MNECVFAGEYLERVETFDYLGLRWQENAQWHAHFAKIATSAQRVANFVGSLITRNGPSPTVIRQLCHALVRTKILYGMPIWHPSKQSQWQKLDSIVALPMRRCLGLPKTACILSVLTEMNTLDTRRQCELLAIRYANRAANLPKDHIISSLRKDQLKMTNKVKRREPLMLVANKFAKEYKVKVSDKLDRKLLSKTAMIRQRLSWRKQGKSPLLQLLSHWDPRLAPHLRQDERSVLITRSRLRFNRSRLRDSQLFGDEAKLPCDDCKVPDTLEHLLFECHRTQVPRQTILEAALLTNLPTSNLDMKHWILGDVSMLDDSDDARTAALDISSQFLRAIASTRPL